MGSTSQDTTPISAQGRFFWKGDERFLIKGVVYRLHGDKAGDPLTDARLGDLRRDITLFKDLGLNVLFVDNIDPTNIHDQSMRLLAEAGVYVLVSLPTAASTTNGAGTTTTFRPYSPQLLSDCFETLDCMAQYPNTLGVVVANGALSTIYSTSAAPMIKTVIRDVKRYMAAADDAVGQRQLPLGYSASSTRLILKTTFDYFTAGKPEETVDFFSYANFNWCGQSTMHSSGYDAELTSFATAQIPIFFSQYGCNLGTCGTRLFQETTAILSPAMTPVFSGGIAYEFYDAPGIQSSHWGFGLVRDEEGEDNNNNNTRPVVGRGLTLLPDYHSLKARLDDAAAQPIATHRREEDSYYLGGSGEQQRDGVAREIPPLSAHWKAGHALPYSVADWGQLSKSLDEKRWVEIDVQRLDVEESPRFVVPQPAVIRA